MIIKITSSTSRMSISGTTFTSATTPRKPPPTEKPMSRLAFPPPIERTLNSREEDSHIPARAAQMRRRSPLQREQTLLPGFELCRNQADLVNAGAAHDVDGASHVHEHHVVIALDEGHLFGAIFENLLDARAELIPIGVFVVDLELVVLIDLDDNGFVFELLVLFLVLVGLRHERIEPLGNQGSDHHENDDENEQNIDQRHDVRRRERTGVTANIHPHCCFSYRPRNHQPCRVQAAPCGKRRGPREPANEWCERPCVPRLSRRTTWMTPPAPEGSWAFAGPGSFRSKDPADPHQPSESHRQRLQHRHILRERRSSRIRSCRGGWR